MSGINRRVLIGGGLAVAGTATLATALGPGSPAEADPAVGDRMFVYKGRTVVVSVSQTMVMVTVDGRQELHVERLPNGKFFTHLMPFQEFTTFRALVLAVIDRADERLFAL